MKTSLFEETLNNNFWVEIRSDLEYENLIVDIFINKKYFASVHQENGMNDAFIEISNQESQGELLDFNFNDFMAAMELAKKHVLEISKEAKG